MKNAIRNNIIESYVHHCWDLKSYDWIIFEGSEEDFIYNNPTTRARPIKKIII